jgi:hypothetical protein
LAKGFDCELAARKRARIKRLKVARLSYADSSRKKSAEARLREEELSPLNSNHTILTQPVSQSNAQDRAELGTKAFSLAVMLLF